MYGTSRQLGECGLKKSVAFSQFLFGLDNGTLLCISYCALGTFY